MSRWNSRVLACLVLLGALAVSPARTQNAVPAPEREAPPEGPATGGQQAIHPDAVSSFRVRVYRTRERKLWKGLLQVLQQAGYPPEEVDEKGMRVKTSFVDFNAKDYAESVADPAPRFTPSYRMIQMTQVSQGKVSLEGVVSHDKPGAVLSLRARLLVDSLEYTKRVRMLSDRRSSGVIEEDFFRRLEEALALERVK